MKQKYLFFDVDGTLYDHKNKRIPPSTIVALEKAFHNGHRIFISTGRSIRHLEHLEDLMYHGTITFAGAFVEAENRTLFKQEMDPAQITLLLELFKENNIAFNLETMAGGFLAPIVFERYKKLIFSNSADADHKMNQGGFFQMKEYKGEEIYKITVFAECADNFDNLRKNLDPKYTLTEITSENFTEKDILIGEITTSGINKFTAIEHLLKVENGDIRDTYAFGDSLNDYEMIKYCNTGIVMGNGDEKLKDVADFVTADIDQDGLYHSLLHFGLITEE